MRAVAIIGRSNSRAAAYGLLAAFLLSTVVSPRAQGEEISIEFGGGAGEVRYVHFDDFSGTETWYMTRCQNAVSPDFYVRLRDYGDVQKIRPVNSALEADKTVCVIGHIPNIVKRYMR